MKVRKGERGEGKGEMGEGRGRGRGRAAEGEWGRGGEGERESESERRVVEREIRQYLIIVIDLWHSGIAGSPCAL